VKFEDRHSFASTNLTQNRENEKKEWIGSSCTFEEVEGKTSGMKWKDRIALLLYIVHAEILYLQRIDYWLRESIMYILQENQL